MPRVFLGDTDFLDRKSGTPGYAASARGLPQHQAIDGRHVYHKDGETVREYLDDIGHSGVLDAITLTDEGGLNISWTAGEVYTPGTPGDIVVTEAGSAACTDDAVNYLVWVSGTTLTLRTTPSAYATEVSVGHIQCQEGDIWELHTGPLISTSVPGIQGGGSALFSILVGADPLNGCLVTEDADATNPLDVSVSAGSYWHDAYDEHPVTQFDTRTANTLIRCYIDGAGPQTWDFTAGQHSVDFANWNSGVTLIATSVNKYYRGMFLISEDNVFWIYGQAEYNTEAQAIAGPNPTVPPGIKLFPASVAYVYKSGEAAFAAAGSDRWIDARPMVGTAATGTVSTADVAGPASSVDNAIVRFDGVTGKIIQDYTSGAPTVGDTGTLALNNATTAMTIATAGKILLRGATPSIYSPDTNDLTITAATGAAGDIVILAGNVVTITKLDLSAITHTGTLKHEQGGLEADVSAYSGFVKITGGATSAVTGVQRSRPTITAVVGTATDYAFKTVVVGISSTPKENFLCWAFHGDETSFLDFHGKMSEDYGGGGLTFKIITSYNLAGSSDTVRWCAAIRRISDGDLDIEVAFDYDAAKNELTVDVPATQGYVTYDEITWTHGADMDSLAAGEMFVLRLWRDHDHADDTPGGATDFAYLHRWELRET